MNVNATEIPNKCVSVGWMPVVYRFMCFSSCVGNLGRRQIQAIFTFESTEGVILGRRTIELRICACPGRDRRNDESAQRTLKRPSLPLSYPVTAPPADKVAKTDDDDQIYLLKVFYSYSLLLLNYFDKP